MHDGQDIQAAIRQAEAAAGRGDMVVAEEFLRWAVELQQAAPGDHPGLADTLNNLAIVCERLGKDDEAERWYRLACATARTAFPSGHPSVTTSEANLREFCEARGLPLEPPPPAAAGAGEPAPIPGTDPLPPPGPPPAPEPLPIPTPVPLPTPPSPPVPPPNPIPGPRSGTPLIPIAIGAVVVVLVLLVWRSGSTPPPATTTTLHADPAPPPARAAAANGQPEASEPPAAAGQPAVGEHPAERAAAPPARAPASPARSEAAKSARPAPPPGVLGAELCRSLQTGAAWHCDPAAATVDAGTVYFYTRLAASADTVVEHRWYHAGRVHQSVKLRIRANAAGYRTYSRMTVTPDRAGDWRVELRSADGRVLSEKRFEVAP